MPSDPNDSLPPWTIRHTAIAGCFVCTVVVVFLLCLQPQNRFYDPPEERLYLMFAAALPAAFGVGFAMAALHLERRRSSFGRMAAIICGGYLCWFASRLMLILA